MNGVRARGREVRAKRPTQPAGSEDTSPKPVRRRARSHFLLKGRPRAPAPRPRKACFAVACRERRSTGSVPCRETKAGCCRPPVPFRRESTNRCGRCRRTTSVCRREAAAGHGPWSRAPHGARHRKPPRGEQGSKGRRYICREPRVPRTRTSCGSRGGETFNQTMAPDGVGQTRARKKAPWPGFPLRRLT